MRNDLPAETEQASSLDALKTLVTYHSIRISFAVGILLSIFFNNFHNLDIVCNFAVIFLLQFRRFSCNKRFQVEGSL